jgi:hypothetical protein
VQRYPEGSIRPLLREDRFAIILILYSRVLWLINGMVPSAAAVSVK